MSSRPVRDRAWRRWQYELAKERIRHHEWRWMDWENNTRRIPGTGPHDAFILGFHARTPKPCSRPWCCGNERYYNGKEKPSIQRKMDAADYREEE
jgi:hypothetical protein